MSDFCIDFQIYTLNFKRLMSYFQFLLLELIIFYQFLLNRKLTYDDVRTTIYAIVQNRMLDIYMSYITYLRLFHT